MRVALKLVRASPGEAGRKKACIIHRKTVNVSAAFPCFSTHFSICLVMLNF